MNEAKQKAQELVDKFNECLNHIAMGSNGIEYMLLERAKTCAEICCDEIITDLETLESNYAGILQWKNNGINFWQSVKNEINLI